MPDKRKSTRRQFLKGRSAIDALEDLADRVTPPDESSPVASVPRSYLVQVARRAMACDFQIYLNAGQHESAVEQAMKALDLVEDLERQLTVYRDDSEVSQLNQRGAHQWNQVESRLFSLLHKAVSISGETGGAFDITSGPLSKLWGFFRRDGRVPSSDDLHVVLQAVGSQWIELDQAQQAVRFTRQGVQINLGGIGKGYALDRCCELLESAGITDFLLHGGHSSVLARGARLQQPSRSGWTVAVRHPLRTEQRLLEIQLHNQALGTSGAAKQYFYHQGRRFGHILDPRTGYPADEVLAATVVAPDAATADALATGFYVLGPIQGERYVDRLGDEVAILLLVAGQRVGAIDVITWGRGELDWRMVPDG